MPSGWADNPEFPPYILPVRPDHFERRVILQKSCFTFHDPKHPTLTKSENGSLRSFYIPQGLKGDIANQLFALGVDSFSIFGDLEGLAKRLKFAYKLA